jgi:hypothetical protein
MKAIKILFFPAMAALLAACSGPAFKDDPTGEFADRGLYPVRSTGFTEVHARRDAGLPDYRTVDIEPLKLDDVVFTTTSSPGTVRRDWTITPERERVLQDAWAAAMDRAFSGYDRGGAGEKVLRISAEMTRVWPRPGSAGGPSAVGVPPGYVGELANISIEIRLYDPAGGELLSVVRDNRDVPVSQWTQGNGRNMVSLFNSWASLLQARVSGR